MHDTLLRAKQHFIEQLRDLTIETPNGPVQHALSQAWTRGAGGQDMAMRDIALPYVEEFSLAGFCHEEGLHLRDLRVERQRDCWVMSGRMCLRTNDGPWVTLRTGDTFQLRPEDTHEFLVERRTYVLCKYTPPLPNTTPRPPHA